MTLRDHLQAIYDQYGRLTPELVVEVARPESHPLHSHVFTHDEATAAAAWYLHQAHKLIQRVSITYKENPDGSEVRGRAFQCVHSDAGFVYEPAEVIAADPLKRQMVLRQMELEWKQMRARYGHFREFAQMVARDVPGIAA